MDWVSFFLAASIFAVLILGLAQRMVQNAGIGWQFIRYTVIAVSVPATALLAFNGKLDAPSAAIIAGCLGYAFGRGGETGNTP